MFYKAHNFLVLIYTFLIKALYEKCIEMVDTSINVSV